MSYIHPQGVPMFGNLSGMTTTTDDQNRINLENVKCLSALQDQLPSIDFFCKMTETPPPTPANKAPSENAEHDWAKFWENNDHRRKGISVEETVQYSNDNNNVREIINHVPSLPSRLRQRINGNNVNFILIATSLDQRDILQQLGNKLDAETSRAIPLTFNKENNREMPKVNVSKELPAHSTKPAAYHKNEESLEYNIRTITATSKRKRVQDADMEYHEQRNMNNSSAKMAHVACDLF